MKQNSKITFFLFVIMCFPLPLLAMSDVESESSSDSSPRSNLPPEYELPEDTTRETRQALTALTVGDNGANSIFISGLDFKYGIETYEAVANKVYEEVSELIRQSFGPSGHNRCHYKTISFSNCAVDLGLAEIIGEKLRICLGYLNFGAKFYKCSIPNDAKKTLKAKANFSK